MRSCLVCAILLSVCAFLAGGCEKQSPAPNNVQKPAAPGSDVFASLSFEQAKAQASAEKKMVMMDFTADWCGWCKKLDADTWSNPEVKQWLKDRAVCIKVDVDQAKGLAGQYKVDGIPDIVFVDAAGKELKRIVGYRSPKDFLSEVASLAK
jgi:thiol:disulfide interchange protein